MHLQDSPPTAVVTTSAATEPRPRSFADLIGRFEAVEALENPDVVLAARELRLHADGLGIPGHGTFALTFWAREQLAKRLGIKWDRWFATTSTGEQADEVNRRLARSGDEVRLRTTRAGANGVSGTLRAFVSSGYSPIRDSRVATLLAEVLDADEDRQVRRFDCTDRSTTYTVAIGKAFRPGDSHEVGDMWGGLIVRNSGVGYASLTIGLHLERLLCKNGMTAPVDDPLLLRRAHRGLDDGRIRDILVARLSGLSSTLRASATRLVSASGAAITDRPGAVREFLAFATLPRRHAPEVLDAWDREPLNSAFGLVQAVTRAAQGMPPEQRFEFESAAGRWLAAHPNVN